MARRKVVPTLSHCLSPWEPHVTTNFLSVAVGFLILNISYKWNRILRSLLCLASFALHHVFKVQPHCSLCQSFIPLYGRVILLYAYTVSCSSIQVGWHLGCFPLLVAINHASTVWAFQSLGPCRLSFLVGRDLGKKRIGHMMNLCWTF